MKNKERVEVELLKRIVKAPGCWTWTGYVMKNGYGSLSTKGNGTRLAHRLVHELFVGPIPDGQYVLHTCDNRKCCNPEHLRLGTQADNMLDKQLKGRAPAKLTPDEVLAIRADDRTLKEIGADYGVHFTTIHLIKTRKKWTHI